MGCGGGSWREVGGSKIRRMRSTVRELYSVARERLSGVVRLRTKAQCVPSDLSF